MGQETNRYADLVEDTKSNKYADSIEHKGNNKYADITEKMSANDSNSNLLGATEYLEAKGNQRSAGGSFLSGALQGFADYGASINKFIGDDEGQKYWENVRNREQASTEEHPYWALGGEVVLDPINLTPAGIVSKGSKAARVAKSMGLGAGIGAGAMTAKDYGNSSMTDEQKYENMAVGAGATAGINGIIAGLTRGKVKGAIPNETQPQTPEVDFNKLNDLVNSIAGKQGDTIPPTNIIDENVAHPSTQTEEQKNSIISKLVGGEQKNTNEVFTPQANTGNQKDLPLNQNEKSTYQEEKPSLNMDEIFDRSNPTNILSHPKLKLFLESRKDITEKQTRYEKRLEQPRDIRVGIGREETEVSPAVYSDNYAGHFRITGNDVKKLTTRENPFLMKNGKFDEALYEKLSNDLGRLDNDPQWAESYTPTPKAGDDMGAGVTVGNDGMLYGKNGVSIFAKGTDNLAAGTIAGVEEDENGNYTLNPEKFIIGLGGYTAAKALLKHPKVQQGIKDEIGKQLQRYEGSMFDTNLYMAPVKSQGQKEMRGIYNVTFNGKNASEVRKADSEAIIKYEQGYENAHTGKGLGALHIEKHLGDGSKGEISKEELIKIGEIVRDGKIKNSYGKNVYELEKNGVKFTVVTGNTKNGKERIITYYSDRNLDVDAHSLGAITSTTPNKNIIPQKDQNIKVNPGNSFGGALGGGMVGGMEDTNGDGIPDNFNFEGALIGAAGGAYLGKKFGGQGTGLFAGKSATGYRQADNAGKAFTGKYDDLARFEIDDSKAIFTPKAFSETRTPNLESVLYHPDLYKQYPELKNIPVHIDPEMKANGTFDGEIIKISPRLEEDEVASTMLHEIQHWIQNKEGFAGGASYGDELRKIDGQIYSLERQTQRSQVDAMNLAPEIERLKNEKSNIAYQNYRNHAGEIEARDVQARKGLSADERAMIPQYSHPDSMPIERMLGEESYTAAQKALIEGRLKDTGAHGIEPEDAILDFSRSTADSFNPTKSNYNTLERLSKERANKDWRDISQNNATFENISNSINHLFKDSFSGEYHQSRDITHTNLQEKSVGVERLAKVIGEFDDTTDKALYQYLTKTGGGNLPQELKAFGDNIRGVIDSLGADLVNRGILTKETVEDWAGSYLHRNYDKTLTPMQLLKRGFKIDKIYERGKSVTFKENEAQKASAWLSQNGIPVPNNITDTPDILSFLFSNNHIGKLSEGKVKASIDGNGKIKLRMDFTKAEREAMGEIESAKYAIPETLMKLYRMKEHADFLERVKDVDGVVLPKSYVKGKHNPDLEREGFKLVRGQQYGALNGRYIRADVEDDIGRMYKDIANAHSDAFRVWNGYHSVWKKSKTVWSPNAHANNTVGNWFLMHLSGANTAELPSILSKGLNQIRSLSKLEDFEVKRIKNTMTPQDFTEYTRLLGEAKFAREAKVNGIFGKSQLNDILAGTDTSKPATTLLGKADQAMSKAYQFEDNFNRLSFYITLRESGRNEKTAKQMVDFMLPDYSKPLPKGWRVLRDSSVAPFISWSYYTMPAIVKMMGTKQGAWNATKVIAALSAMEYVATNGDITPVDNLPFYEGNKPKDFKGRRFAYNQNGDMVDTIKMDRVIPYAELQNPINYSKSVFSGILPNLAFTAQGKQMYSGRDITYENKSVGDKSIDWMKHIANQYAPIPVPVTSGLDMLDKSLRGNQRQRTNNTVHPRSDAQNILKSVGINTLSYSENRAKKENKGK